MINTALALPSINRAAIYDPESRHGTLRLPSEKQLAQSALARLGRAQDDWVRDINDLLNVSNASTGGTHR